VSVATLQDVTPHSPLKSVSSTGEGLLLWAIVGDDATSARGVEQLTVYGRQGIDALDPSLWRRVLYKVAARETPPLAHLFLRDARAELHRGHHRRAVIEAGTAAEIALNELLNQELQTAPPNIRGAFLASRRWTLEALHKTLPSLGVALPNRFQSHLMEPRNRAVHAGAVPVGNAAADAIMVATQAIELISPRAKLL
jgi:hypothetical protein